MDISKLAYDRAFGYETLTRTPFEERRKRTTWDELALIICLPAPLMNKNPSTLLEIT